MKANFKKLTKDFKTMDEEKCNLKWHTYTDHLKSLMEELMMNEDFADITLVTEDKRHISAHINILSACSPVFKGILKKGKNSNTVMYLKGIKFDEMKSIIQFIYLGKVTFNEESLNDFLAVGRLLEIKGLCDDKTEKNDKPENKLVTPNAESITENEHSITVRTQDTRYENANVCVRLKKLNWENFHANVQNANFECEECQKIYSDKYGLKKHQLNVHQGFKYYCDQCDFQAFTSRNSLVRHIQNVHEGVRYPCDQCETKLHSLYNLKIHKQTKHEGISNRPNRQLIQRNEVA